MDYSFEEDLKIAKNSLPRDKMEALYQMLIAMEWESINGVNLKDLVTGYENKGIDNKEVDIMGAADDIIELVNIREPKYSDDDSEKFMRKVLASNVTEISDSGYFYKKLNAALDDFVLSDEERCNSEGETYSLTKTKDNNNILNYDSDNYLSEKFFDYYLKNCYVVFDDSKDEVTFVEYKDFRKASEGHKTVTVFNPLNCEFAPKRCICPRCMGVLNNGGRKMGTKNIGVLTSFCITEPVTQASLSSMNNGISKSPNKILESRIPVANKRFTWDEAKDAIRDVVNTMFTDEFVSHSKFYQISIMGKIFEDGNGKFFQTAFKNASMFTKDKFSSFLFNSSISNMRSLIKSSEEGRKLEGIKSKLLFCKEE